MGKRKYNLSALHDREVTSTITAYLNGRATAEEVEKQLDKVCVVLEPVDDGLEDLQTDLTEEDWADVHSDYAAAIAGKKDDLIAFANKYGIDLSEAKNNDQRIVILTSWYEGNQTLQEEE